MSQCPVNRDYKKDNQARPSPDALCHQGDPASTAGMAGPVRLEGDPGMCRFWSAILVQHTHLAGPRCCCGTNQHGAMQRRALLRAPSPIRLPGIGGMPLQARNRRFLPPFAASQAILDCCRPAFPQSQRPRKRGWPKRCRASVPVRTRAACSYLMSFSLS